jgi:hypothetical protein
MPGLQELNNTSAADDLDDGIKKIDILMAIQLMKVSASLHATNAVKRRGDGRAASQ